MTVNSKVKWFRRDCMKLSELNLVDARTGEEQRLPLFSPTAPPKPVQPEDYS